MLPSLPEDTGVSGGSGGLKPAVQHTRKRAGWLIARDAAGASAGSALAGLAVSVGAHSALVGAITGGVIWVAAGAGVVLTAWLRAFRRGSGKPIDPWALPEPWRGLVRDAVNAGRRFEVATATLPAGPLRDHVTALEPSVAQQVRAIWETAQRGAALTGGVPAGHRPESAPSLSERLRSLQDERASLENGPPDRIAELERSEAATASQLREAKRAESVADWLQDGLRSAITRLEAAVTSLAELGGQPSNPVGSAGLGLSLDSVGEELSALQAGLQEIGGALPPGQGLPVNRRKP